jgi:hypothetical protein
MGRNSTSKSPRRRPLLLVIHLRLVLPHAIVSAHVAMNAREGFATRKRVARAETTDRTGPAGQCQAQPDATRPVLRNW